MEPENQSKYIPALRFDTLTSLYDPIIQFSTREQTFKPALVRQANVQNGQRLLDLGCGTATLTMMVKKAYPDTDIVGLDGDPKILTIARKKAEAAGMLLAFDEGLSFDLPYPDGSFDRVLSSLFFHHLTPTDKQRTLAEAFRVLRPGGELHIADWGQAYNSLMRLLFYSVQLLDGFATTTDNVNGRLPTFIQQAGFANVSETTRFSTIYGTLALYRAKKPD
jgi:ubiquinone/menaquinone biosynthesis C-methylase UbiE